MLRDRILVFFLDAPHAPNLELLRMHDRLRLSATVFVPAPEVKDLGLDILKIPASVPHAILGERMRRKVLAVGVAAAFLRGGVSAARAIVGKGDFPPLSSRERDVLYAGRRSGKVFRSRLVSNYPPVFQRHGRREPRKSRSLQRVESRKKRNGRA